jgi:hypothetical protein
MSMKIGSPSAIYRSSPFDLLVWGLAGLAVFLFFWPPFMKAARSGDVVRFLDTKPAAMVKATVRSAPSLTTRKAASRPR